MLADIGEADVAPEQIDDLRKAIDPSMPKALAERRDVTSRTATHRCAELEQCKAPTVASDAFLLFEDRAAAIAFDCQRDEEHQRQCYRK